MELNKYVGASGSAADDKNEELLNVLRGDSTTLSSVIVSSNLRRALATTTLGLWNRLDKTGEKVVVLSSLQEVSRNIDTASLSDAKSVPDMSRIQPHCTFSSNSPKATRNDIDPREFECEVYDSSENMGNKSTALYGIKRFKMFNEWVFNRPEDVIIVGGHSLWFKYFFQTFMPHASNHEAKNKKIVNSGMVSFVLSRTTENPSDVMYGVDEERISTVYGGFERK